MVFVPRLTVLDVGHGNSAVVQDTHGVVIVDAGRRNSVLEFLREQRITRADVVLISHADQDHLGGLLALISSRTVDISIVRMNSDSTKRSALWDDVLYELDQMREAKEIDFEPVLTADDTGKYDQGLIHIEVLAPSAYLAGKGPGSRDRDGRELTTNSISAVIRLLHDDKPVALLPGDIDDVGLRNLVSSGKEASAPILLFPHHGGQCGDDDLEEFAYELCELVHPEVVIFSIGRKQFTNPQPEAVRGVRRSRGQVWIACTQLSKHCATDLPASVSDHLVPGYAAGKMNCQSCAGTMVFDLHPYGRESLPLYTAHQDFIVRSAPTALCHRYALFGKSPEGAEAQPED